MDFERAVGRAGSSPAPSWTPPALPRPLGLHPAPSLFSCAGWAGSLAMGALARVQVLSPTHRAPRPSSGSLAGRGAAGTPQQLLRSRRLRSNRVTLSQRLCQGHPPDPGARWGRGRWQ